VPGRVSQVSRRFDRTTKLPRPAAHAPGVARVLLKGEAQHCQLLAGDGVEQLVDDALHKAALLVVVDRNNLSVCGRTTDASRPMSTTQHRSA